MIPVAVGLLALPLVMTAAAAQSIRSVVLDNATDEPVAPCTSRRAVSKILADLAADQARTGWSFGEYALLYRTREVGSRLEQEFLRAGVPCRLAHGRAVRDDEVMAYVTACLRLLLAPDDSAAQAALAALVLPEQLLERLWAEGPASGRPLVVKMGGREGWGVICKPGRGARPRLPGAPSTQPFWIASGRSTCAARSAVRQHRSSRDRDRSFSEADGA